MRDIYRAANCVIAWLGEETSDSKRALDFLREMAPYTDRMSWLSESSDSESTEDEQPKRSSKDEVIKSYLASWEHRLGANGSKLSGERWRTMVKYLKEIELNGFEDGHLITEEPVLYYMNDGIYKTFFEDGRQADWGALDKLLVRPWWSHT